jgi:hypothetical protein
MNDIPGISFDPYVVLIEWFTSRTERGHLMWNIETEAITASVSLPPLVHIRFATRADVSSKCVRWNSFYVRDNHNKELFHINSDHAANDSATLPAVNALFITALRNVR